MTYQTVMTVEKPGSDVRKILANSPGWLDIEACFPFDSPFCWCEERLSADKSYMEFIATYPDQEIYELWYEAYSDVHDPARTALLEFLESQDVVVNRYYQTTDLAKPDGVYPIEDFVSRADLIVTQMAGSSLVDRCDEPT